MKRKIIQNRFAFVIRKKNIFKYYTWFSYVKSRQVWIIIAIMWRFHEFKGTLKITDIFHKTLQFLNHLPKLPTHFERDTHNKYDVTAGGLVSLSKIYHKQKDRNQHNPIKNCCY